MNHPADQRTSPLFHAIVVMGAALGGGCGADEVVVDAPTQLADAAPADARADAGPDAKVDATPGVPDAMIIIL